MILRLGANPTMNKIGITVQLLVVLFLLMPGCERSQTHAVKEPGDWLFPDMPYRVAVNVNAGLYPRKDELVSCKFDFEKLMGNAGKSGAKLDKASLRVGAGQVPKQKEIPSYLQNANPDALVWRVPGALEPLENKKFWIYFDAQGGAPRVKPDYPSLEDSVPEKLAINGGFEEPDPGNPRAPKGWETVSYQSKPREKGAGEFDLVESPVHSGKYAVKIRPLDGKFFFGRLKVPLKPNKLYRLSAWVKLDEGNAVTGLIAAGRALVYSDKGASPDGFHGSGASPGGFYGSAFPLFGKWTQFSINGMRIDRVPNQLTPTNAAWCNIIFFIYQDKGSAVSNVFYLDDVEMVEVKTKTGATKEVPPMEATLGLVEKRSK